ncbi:serpin family protein [Dyadobacter sp. CY261]|uniref:serpin family protein n=1 Tax=Dyadobacter sp. CY261 TaxID=2907203 RepID=UPI001F40D615|nr:serpin family protein [Dyadobacter sp. CY261]MCF0071687.1 serpin family protein [Dyadobacter sp. CY261]
MKISKRLITVPMLAATMLFGCTNDNVNPGAHEVNPVEIPESVSNGTTSFAFDFIHALQTTQSVEENLFVSPLSLHMALGMLLNGAEEETAQEIKKALKMDDVALSELNAAYKTLINDLPVADPKVSLGLANSVWYRNDFAVENDFQSVLKDAFESEVTGLPFDNTAKDRINKWASDKTNGKIQKVLEKIEPNHVMFLLNALYFKGNWKYQFDPKKTLDTPFKLESGQSKNVKMMYAKSDFKVGSGTNYDAVELPYANGQFNMTLLIPKGENKIDDVLKGLSGTSWSQLTSGLTSRGVTVGLPKFTLDYSGQLKETLQGMGIQRAFHEGAQLGKINKAAKLYVDFVKQDAYLGIDEQGTEAAAVTTIGIGLTSAGPQEPRYICDKPFALIISENTSNTILFVGRIKNPESK